MTSKDEDKLDIINRKIDELKILMEAKFAAHLSYHAKKLEEENKLTETISSESYNDNNINNNFLTKEQLDKIMKHCSIGTTIHPETMEIVECSLMKPEVEQNAIVKSSSNKKDSRYKRKKVLSI